MPNYVRAYVPGGTFFFTVTLLNRRLRLLTDRINDLRNAFHEVHAKRPFVTEAIVVLPDHLHCIWTLPPDDADYSTRWRLIKRRFDLCMPATEALSPRRRKIGERGIWQRRFWEHAIRDERDLALHIDYIHYSPVKHGHARAAADWQHSSIHRYIARGDLPADWASEPGELESARE